MTYNNIIHDQLDSCVTLVFSRDFHSKLNKDNKALYLKFCASEAEIVTLNICS